MLSIRCQTCSSSPLKYKIMVPTLCRTPHLGNGDQTTWLYTLVQFSSSWTSKKPHPQPHPTLHGLRWTVCLQEEKEAPCLHQGVPPSLLLGVISTHNSLYLLEDIGVFPHCPISPAMSLGVDPTLPPKWWEWMHFSHYLFYVQSPFITNVTSLIMFCCSYSKLVMMTYLCQISIWREFLLIVNVHVKNKDEKGCCHLTCREMRVSQRGQDPLLFLPQGSPIFQFWAI